MITKSNSSTQNDAFLLESDILEVADRLQSELPSLDGKHVLITGGGGFLGRYFSDVVHFANTRLFKSPCEITILDNLITSANSSWSKGRPNLKFVQHDITLPYEFASPFDFIIHAAGIASPYYYRKYPLKTLEVATTGTRLMLDLARTSNAQFLYFSSSEIYGDPTLDAIPTNEEYNGNISCLGPRACYDEGKRLGETLCRVFFEEFASKVKIVRPFNVYGPGMKERDYRVLPNFASAAVGRRPLQVYGNGDQTRTFCYVTDAITGFIKALIRGRDGEAYNIGNPSPEISMVDLARQIQQLWKSPLEVKITPYPDSYIAKEPRRRCPDLSKAAADLDYHPQVSLEKGLLRFLEWTRHNYTGLTPE